MGLSAEWEVVVVPGQGEWVIVVAMTIRMLDSSIPKCDQRIDNINDLGLT